VTVSTIPHGEQHYFAVSPNSMRPRTVLPFDVHVRRDDSLVLYMREGEFFTARHRRELCGAGTGDVYVWEARRSEFDSYVEGNLGDILLDERLPVEERSRVFNDTSAAIVHRVLEHKLPQGISRPTFDRMLTLVRDSIRHLSAADFLRTVTALVSHDFRTYSHSIHVFVYASALLHTYGLDDATMVQCGLGAILHDVGKTEVPAHILNKPGPLSEREWRIVREHPRRGLEMCADLPLSEHVRGCILHHHEKADGGGYPDGLSAEAIPLPVRVLTLADIYDALTSTRPYAKACTPFEALRVMRNEMGACLDTEAFRRLVAILGSARLL
jgi:putative nucleotidyltransferase with HDIG domain